MEQNRIRGCSQKHKIFIHHRGTEGTEKFFAAKNATGANIAKAGVACREQNGIRGCSRKNTKSLFTTEAQNSQRAFQPGRAFWVLIFTTKRFSLCPLCLCGE